LKHLSHHSSFMRFSAYFSSCFEICIPWSFSKDFQMRTGFREKNCLHSHFCFAHSFRSWHYWYVLDWCLSMSYLTHFSEIFDFQRILIQVFQHSQSMRAGMQALMAQHWSQKILHSFDFHFCCHRTSPRILQSNYFCC